MSTGPRLHVRKFDWDEARRLHAEGMTYRSIAQRFGVAESSVRLACDDDARRHANPRYGDKVERIGLVERIAGFFVFASDGCWHWTGARFDNGYGAFWHGTRNARAHRVMYEILAGPVPAGLELDHLCRVRHCVNPGHLEPVTRAENLRRSPFFNRERSHCSNGHELTEANTHVEATGYRRCRVCQRDYHRARRREAAKATKGALN